MSGLGERRVGGKKVEGIGRGRVGMSEMEGRMVGGNVRCW